VRIAESLERIANAAEALVEALAMGGEGPVEDCPHPMEECEPTINSTMQNVVMRCKACGAEGI